MQCSCLYKVSMRSCYFYDNSEQHLTIIGSSLNFVNLTSFCFFTNTQAIMKLILLPAFWYQRYSYYLSSFSTNIVENLMQFQMNNLPMAMTHYYYNIRPRCRTFLKPKSLKVYFSVSVLGCLPYH